MEDFLFCLLANIQIMLILNFNFSGYSDGREVSWMDSTLEEIALWQAMLDRPNCWIEGTLLLRLHMNQLK